MSKIEIGSKVVDVYCGEEGVVTGINHDADPEDVMGETAWWVLWVTGSCAGKELWMVESDLVLFSEYDPEEFPQHAFKEIDDDF